MSEQVAEATDRLAVEVEEHVRRRPWLEAAAQMGWVAKGVVYVMFGATATQIARQEPSDDEASPNGALNRVMEQPGGRLLIAVLAVGLVLYVVWRVLSVAVIRDHDANAWAHRVGYGFSAAFYAVLAYTATRIAMRGSESQDSNTVERLSRTVMELPLGRAAVGVAGLVTIGVGLYFVIRKGVMRSFTDDLRGVETGDGDAFDRLVVVSGVVGWVGRGIVTVLVGVLVLRAAIQFDPDEARGFDGALRRVAESPTGTVFVWISAIGLILYGVFCLLSHRRRRVEDNC